MPGKPTREPAARWTYVLVSLLMLAPVYWQPRLHGGDLTSHMNNSWLTQWIETGRSAGLDTVRQTTNVLFDLLLAGMFRISNPEFAQRFAVSIAVLTFIWGAFAFVSKVSGRRPWHLLSCIAILAYGWVFHMGFFSFYLSLGICFWILSLLWEPSPRRIAAAVPLALLAYVAHVLPLIWAVGLLFYMWIAPRISQRARAWVAAVSLAGMFGIHAWLDRAFFALWIPARMHMSSSAEQGWFFDGKYYLVLAGLLLAWGLLFLETVRAAGPRRVVESLPFQLCIVSALGVVLLPGTLLIPGFSHALVYIAERMSLGVGICVCAVLGSAQPRVVVRYTLVVVTLIFFGFLYGDERKLNAAEDRRQDTVAIVLAPRPQR